MSITIVDQCMIISKFRVSNRFVRMLTMYTFIIEFFLIYIVLINAKFLNERREFSLVRPYFAGKSFSLNWDYSGSTLVTEDYIRLTPDVQSRSGRLWMKTPNPLKNWQAILQFKVHGKSTLFGDGLAFWYTKQRMTQGSVFGSMNNFEGLAVFLDTYSNHNGPHNHEHPYISAMINNGSLIYDHDRDGTHTQLAGCESKFRKLEHNTFILIKYEKNVLTVSTDIDGRLDWKLCFSVSGVHLPTNYYFGFSASTGDLSDFHDIISFKIFEIPTEDKVDYSQIIPSADNFEPPRMRVNDVKSSGWTALKIFFLIFFSLVFIIIVAIVGFYLYQGNRERNMKRFY